MTPRIRRLVVFVALTAAVVLLTKWAWPSILRVGRGISQVGYFFRRNLGIGRFDVPVRFWGRVIDPDGKPLAGVTIAGDVKTLRVVKTPTGYQDFSTLQTKSDADGRFLLEGAAGFSLTLTKISLDGYVLPSAYQEAIPRGEAPRYAYRYAKPDELRPLFRPDPNRPVLFHLWKLREPQPLAFKGRFDFPSEFFNLPNEPTCEIHLFRSRPYDPPTPEEKGDLSLRLEEIPNSPSKSWRLTVAAVEPEAGVQKAPDSDPFLFEAPASGYVAAIDYVLDETDTDYSRRDPGLPVRFFVRCKGGAWHAAVEARFFAPESSGRVRAKWLHWLNPKGSRNLEHDGSKPLPEPSPPPPPPKPSR